MHREHKELDIFVYFPLKYEFISKTECIPDLFDAACRSIWFVFKVFFFSTLLLLLRWNGGDFLLHIQSLLHFMIRCLRIFSVYFVAGCFDSFCTPNFSSFVCISIRLVLLFRCPRCGKFISMGFLIIFVHSWLRLVG